MKTKMCLSFIHSSVRSFFRSGISFISDDVQDLMLMSMNGSSPSDDFKLSSSSDGIW